MAKPIIIAVNQTAGDITLADIGGAVVPASSQINLTSGDKYSFAELQKSLDLYGEVNSGNVLINEGTRTLSQTESLNYLTAMSTVNTDDVYLKNK